MKIFLLKRLQGLHFYYSTGATAASPYTRTMSVLLLLCFLHYVEIFLLLVRVFEIKAELIPAPEGAGKGLRAFFIIIYSAPVYFVLTVLFPKGQVSESSIPDERLIKYRNQFFAYGMTLLLIISATLLIN